MAELDNLSLIFPIHKNMSSPTRSPELATYSCAQLRANENANPRQLSQRSSKCCTLSAECWYLTLLVCYSTFRSQVFFKLYKIPYSATSRPCRLLRPAAFL